MNPPAPAPKPAYPPSLGPPEFSGPIGDAWKVPIISPPGLVRNPIAAQWLFWGPLIAKERQFWVVSAIDLTPTPGYPAPIIRTRHATHELVVYGVQGDTMPSLTTHGGIVIAQPPNLTAQFAATGEHAVAELAYRVARGCCDGMFFPEPAAIGGSGEYHAEYLAVLLEQIDPGWHLTRGARPPLGLSQREKKIKEWTITPAGKSRIHLN